MALFDHSAKTYDEWCKTPLGSFVDTVEKQMIVELSDLKPGEQALDIGCGTGIYSLLLALHGLEVTGIDISSEMLQRAKEKAEKQKQSIHFMEGDIHNLPFEDNTFDLVISNLVLEFVDSPNDVIAEGMRVLKPEGRMVVGMIGKKSDWAKMYKKRGEEKKESVFAGAHFFSLEDINKLYQNEPSLTRFGLYVSPHEFISQELAYDLEKERSAKQQEEGAGFIVAQWIALK
ncbi:class I SAM-dependent methyltransferase [Ectobacillus sp. sgz5001026]|uniref:class I SAM-dependent methyltransferase n=1 Tax=Ectobacillus sp. sgz5001026 TaxID=3242473 RepID=UPI0036D23476